MEIRTYNTSAVDEGFDINVDQIGYEMCKPTHRYGPAVRQHYLLHYVKQGKGMFTYGGKTIAVRRGELFLILPNEVTFYIADAKNPWEYYWFGVSGACCGKLLKEAGFSEGVRKMKYDLSSLFSIDETIAELTKMKIMSKSDKLYETAKIYEIFSWLIKNAEKTENAHGDGNEKSALLNAAMEYIKRGYTRDMAVTDIARHIGTDRTQLYRYFMQAYGKSPQRCLMDIRMNEARKLLKNTKLSVKQIAYSVGYKDQYLFSKMFKKEHGHSPKNYRENS